MQPLLGRVLIAATLALGLLVARHSTSPAPVDASSTGDPALAQQVVVDGSPLADTPVIVVAMPVDQSSWRFNDPFPVVGSGATDQNGYVNAALDPGLGGIQGNPAFENESDGRITLGVEYTGTAGKSILAFTPAENLTPYDDPILQQHVLEAPGGSVLANTSLVVKAEAQYTAHWPHGAAFPELATCGTDGQGHPDCALDLNNVQANGNFDQRGVLTYDVWYQSADGLKLGFRAREHVEAGWDPVLQQQTVSSADGSPLASTAVVVRAVPVDPTRWSGREYPQIGSGTTDASGYVRADVSPGDLVNDPTFVKDGSVTLDVDYTDSNGADRTGLVSSQDLGARPEPVMARQQVVDGSGAPLSGAAVLARLEPVDPTTWTGGDYPVVGVGMVDSFGHPVMTPALGDYVGNSTFETANEVMVVDLYRQASDRSWTMVTRVPYYLGRNEDPVLARTQVLTTGGSQVDNQAVLVRAMPLDPSSWPSGQVFPPVGTGSTDAEGMVHARIDLVHLRNEAKFEDGSGTIKLGVYYYDSGQNPQLGAIADEQLTGTGDLIFIPPVENSSGQPDSSTKVVLKADPLGDGTSAFDPSGQPTLATTETDANGDVSAPLNLSAVAGNSQYITPSGILGGVGVFTADSSGQLTYQSTATEYIGSIPDSPCCGGWTPETVDVTQTAWGAAEPYGCVYTSPAYPQPQCVYGSDGYPALDPVTSHVSRTAITINLNWSSVEPLGPATQYQPNWETGGQNGTGVDQEVAAAVRKGIQVVLLPRFQTGGTGAPTCPTTQSGFTDQYLPYWVYTALPSADRTCDSHSGNAMWMPNYWSSVFQTDWQSFVLAVANHFGTKYTHYSTLVNAGYVPSDVLYARAGAGLGDEGYPYAPNASSNVPTSYQTWATNAVQSGTPCASPRYSSFPSDFEAWQKCMMTQYQTDFNFTSVMYPVNNPQGENLDSVATGEWALGQGMGIGQDGLHPVWALDANGNDDPGNPVDTTAQAILQVGQYGVTHSYVPPQFFELQTYSAATQDCPGGSPPCTAWSQTSYPSCAGPKVTENVYLAQYYGATVMEAYHNDLDDTNSTVANDYYDWTNKVQVNDQTQLFPNGGGICPDLN